MGDDLPARRPECPQHGPMALRPGWTTEQRWCGTWYACEAPRCQTAHLLPSMELLVSLAEQQARFEGAQQLVLGEVA